MLNETHLKLKRSLQISLRCTSQMVMSYIEISPTPRLNGKTRPYCPIVFHENQAGAFT